MNLIIIITMWLRMSIDVNVCDDVRAHGVMYTRACVRAGAGPRRWPCEGRWVWVGVPRAGVGVAPWGGRQGCVVVGVAVGVGVRGRGPPGAVVQVYYRKAIGKPPCRGRCVHLAMRMYHIT